MNRVAILAAVAAFLVLASPAGAAPAKAKKPSCNPESVMGGEWRSYGGDLSNTRHQAREHGISPADAPLLTPAWTFSTVSGGGTGDITGTPAIAGACLFVASTEGWVFALHADTGRMVWRKKVPYGGGVNGSVTAAYGRVYVGVTRLQKQKGCPKKDPCIGPYVVALDQKTGKVKFASRPLDKQTGSDVYGSPVVFPNPSGPAPKKMKRAVLMIGISGGSAELGDEADRYAFQGSMVFVDPKNGKVLVKRWTIAPPSGDKPPKGDFAGAGVWSTPAVDPKAKVAYAGTANPFKPQAEHKYANSVLKYGIDRRNKKTFGKILGHYKGNIDEYVPGLSELPCSDIPGNPAPYYPQGIGSCGDIDLDFGSAPNLFRDTDGKLVVGAGQKSGVYHVFDAKTMKGRWTQIVGPPTPVGGIVGSTAYDGKSVFGPVTTPGYLWSLAADDGAHQWVGPIGDGVHWGNPVAVANGVVYSTDLTGFLDAYDARTGLQLAKRPLALGGSGAASASWAGVAIARHTVYATVGIRGLPEGFIVAFRPGSPTDVPADGQETLTGGGDDSGGAPPPEGEGGGGGEGGDGGGGGGSGATIVAGPGAYSSTYATPAAIMDAGGAASFINFDIAQHDVVANDKGGNGEPLFRSKLIGFNATAPVEGAEKLKPGQYGFFCSIHPGMRGELAVQ